MEGEKRGIILLSIDALRADHLSCYGYCRETSPTIDNIAKNGVQFWNAFSASSHTREAIPALLTGRYPNNAVDKKFHRDSDTIATHLKDTPYTTAAFHSNPYISRAYDFDADFDYFDDDLNLGKHKVMALAQRALDKLLNRHYSRAEEINKRSLNWLDSLDEGPFFLWNHYMDVHGPYEPPGEYHRWFHDGSVAGRESSRLYKRSIKSPEMITSAEKQSQIDLYDGEIKYLDTQIRKFIDALKRRNLLKDSLLLLTADHGDAFGEHGYYGHPRYLHNELLHVPMIVYGNDSNQTTVEQTVSTLDIVPTILQSANQAERNLPGVPLDAVWKSPEEFNSRRVISQARGEKSDRMVWRFSAQKENTNASMEMDTKNGSIRSLNGPESLTNELRQHVRERIDDLPQSEAIPDEVASDEIEQRLSALGYKE